MDDNHLQMPFTFDYYSPSYTLRLDEEHMDKVPYILQRISSACDRPRMRFPQTHIEQDSEQARAVNHSDDLLRLLNSVRSELEEGNRPSKRKTFASPSEDSPSEPPRAQCTFVLAHRIVTIPSGPRAKRIFWGLSPSQVRNPRFPVSSITQGELRMSDPLDASLPGVTTSASGQPRKRKWLYLEDEISDVSRGYISEASEVLIYEQADQPPPTSNENSVGTETDPHHAAPPSKRQRICPSPADIVSDVNRQDMFVCAHQ